MGKRTKPAQRFEIADIDPWIDKRQFRSLLADLSDSHFDKNVRRGLIPPPIKPFGGKNVWRLSVARAVLDGTWRPAAL
jgi:hypothetical protein